MAKWYRIGADRIPEHKINTYRLRCQMENDDAGGLKARELLLKAEDSLERALILYLKRGGSEELIMRMVKEAAEIVKERK